MLVLVFLLVMVLDGNESPNTSVDPFADGFEIK